MSVFPSKHFKEKKNTSIKEKSYWFAIPNLNSDLKSYDLVPYFKTLKISKYHYVEKFLAF